MRIGVAGAGRVGLVRAGLFAHLGHHVLCVDADPAVIDELRQGRLPVHEPGLADLVARGAAEGRLAFGTDLAEAVRHGEIIFVAIDASIRGDSVDLSILEDTARAIGRGLDAYRLIVTTGGAPLGIAERLRSVVAGHRREAVEFDVAANPEFTRPGSGPEDLLRPDRVVIGVPNRRAASKLLELYGRLERPLLITDVATAEVIRLASSAFLAAKLSFANAMADLCERAGADGTQVLKGVGLDRRIGSALLNAGLDGSSLDADCELLLRSAAKLGCEFGSLSVALELNRSRARWAVERLRVVLGSLERRSVGVLGLAARAGTDEVLGAPGLELVRALDAAGATVRACDPVAAEKARPLLPRGVRYCESPYDAVEGVDAVVVVTDPDELRLLDLVRLRAAMNRPVLFDGRGFLDPTRMRRLGFEYHAFGVAVSGKPTRGPVLPPPAVRAGIPVIAGMSDGHHVTKATAPSTAGRPAEDGTSTGTTPAPDPTVVVTSDAPRRPR
jgi:UDPglucose 6-dehydrogenase